MGATVGFATLRSGSDMFQNCSSSCFLGNTRCSDSSNPFLFYQIGYITGKCLLFQSSLVAEVRGNIREDGDFRSLTFLGVGRLRVEPPGNSSEVCYSETSDAKIVF